MKHYVLGLIFNEPVTKVLLIQKLRPEWQKGRWNGIGGKVEKGESPAEAMARENKEESGMTELTFVQRGTFICPGGTVFVFMARTETVNIQFDQKEDELLMEMRLDSLPERMMANLQWIIPLCLANTEPFLINQVTLGIE
jgi:8-oxo-dGTP diphosphatase